MEVSKVPIPSAPAPWPVRPERTTPEWRRCVPWLVLVLSLLATGVTWDLARDQARTRAEERFKAAADLVRRDIERRMLAYDQVLKGAAGLFAASDVVTRAEWRLFVQGQGIEEHFPGIRGLGYIEYVVHTNRAGFLKTISKDREKGQGPVQFTIHPGGDREDYFVIKYIEPIERNGQALAYDIGAEPTRRRAAEQARDIGDAVLTGRLYLVQSTNKTPGVLLLRPIYRKQMPLENPAQRRAALEGWVYGAFQLDELMQEVLRENPAEVALEIREKAATGAEDTPGPLLYQNDRRLKTGPGVPGRLFSTSRVLEFARQTWQLDFRARQRFAPLETWNKPGFVGGAGIFGSLLLFGLTYAVASTRARAQSLARDITRTLEVQEQAMSSSSTSITILDATRPGLSIIYANPAVERMTGYTPRELIGQDGSILLGSEREQEGVAALAAAVQERREERADIRCRRKDGSLFWCEIRLSPVRTRAGAVTHFVSISTDITQRVEAEAKLRSAQAAAETASQAKNEFMANMSHEIRTPLNAVLGLTELVLDTPLDKEQRRLLLSVRQSADELTALVDDILDFSRIEAGRLELQPEAFRLRPYLEGAVGAFAPRAREKQLDLDLRITPDVPEVLYADSQRLRQVLVNLVGNAIKFTHQGHITVEVRRRPGAEPSAPPPAPAAGRAEGTIPPADLTLEFIVSDTGIGIHPSKHAAIFQPFTQADNSITRHFGGTGLGLAICQRLVTLLGGEIWVDSAEGQGSRFHFTVRCRPASEADVRVPELLPAPAVRARRHLRVLVAEDNPVNAQLATAFLERLGHSVIQVTDGHQAVAAASRGNVDLVLMDLQMPGLDGLQATTQIRAQERERGGHLPIIAVTAHALASNRTQCLAAGMDDYLAKPIRRADLYAAVDRAYPGAAPKPASQPPTEISPARTRLLTQLGGDQAAVRRILQLFLETTPPLLATLAEAAGARDAARLHHAAHTLKGSLMQLGDERARAAALLVEGAASAGQIDTALAALPGLERETRRMMEELRGSM